MKLPAAKKSFGQNFLTDKNILNKIADAIARHAAKHPDASIVEFGTGPGALTGALLERGLTFTTIERDREMIPIIKERFRDETSQNQLILIEGDAIAWQPNLPAQTRWIFCGNLPYQLTASFFFKTLDHFDSLDGAVYVIQKEVAERICSQPGNKVYGMLSVLIQARFSAKLTAKIPRGAFVPSPKVESALIELVPIQPLVDTEKWADYVKLVKKAFSSRRKTLKNTLGLDLSLFEKAGINPGARAETLSAAEFAKLL